MGLPGNHKLSLLLASGGSLERESQGNHIFSNVPQCRPRAAEDSCNCSKTPQTLDRPGLKLPPFAWRDLSTDLENSSVTAGCCGAGLDPPGMSGAQMAPAITGACVAWDLAARASLEVSPCRRAAWLRGPTLTCLLLSGKRDKLSVRC